MSSLSSSVGHLADKQERHRPPRESHPPRHHPSRPGTRGTRIHLLLLLLPLLLVPRRSFGFTPASPHPSDFLGRSGDPPPADCAHGSHPDQIPRNQPQFRIVRRPAIRNWPSDKNGRAREVRPRPVAFERGESYPRGRVWIGRRRFVGRPCSFRSASDRGRSWFFAAPDFADCGWTSPFPGAAVNQAKTASWSCAPARGRHAPPPDFSPRKHTAL